MHATSIQMPYLSLHSLSMSTENAKNNTPRYLDVAVIGAGAAGAYSAYRLRNENLTVEVFEYSDRVGGRLYTSSLPNVPDVPLELGGMRFIPKVQPRMERLVKELGLTPRLFSIDHKNFSESRFFLRGKSLLPQDMTSGDVPYNLNPEEKANQGRIFRYYLEKLTGYNGTNVDEVILLNLKVPDGRYLYTVPIDEAVAMVGSEEGKNLMLALDQFESDLAADTSLSFLENNLGPYSLDNPAMTLEEGMSSLPKELLQVFLKSGPGEARVSEAINAVREVNVFRTMLTFSTRWWMDGSAFPALVIYSDLSFSQFYDWGRSNVTGHYVMMASYADETRADYLGKLNSEGTSLNGSASGSQKVSREVVDKLLDDLAKVYGIDRRYVPEPISATAFFWNSYPFGGGWTVWRAGYHYDDVISTVQRPSFTDDVFYVGADHARGYHVGWVEGALETVDRVIDLYFM
ncbi:hypothetical protein Btru_055495 [Bulinus truncatus]|nr:hypothetical protein Btru_055495 [Bulinus truncatus]